MSQFSEMVKQWFSADAGASDPEQSRKGFLVAAAVLLLEIAKSDEDFSRNEKEIIKRILTEELRVEHADVDTLLKQAEKNRHEKTDMWEHTNIINQYASHGEKIRLIEMAWEIVFSDHRMDKYEDYLMHKLSDLLRVSHDELIAAKLKMKPAGYQGR